MHTFVIPKNMHAVDHEVFGDPSVLRNVERPVPEVRPNDLLVRVRAAGVNRADINQRQGKYGANPSFGDSDLLGLEISGEVVALGAAVEGFRLGDRVMGIVGGGGYAQYARIDAGMAIPVPDCLTDIEAAAVTESFVTAHQALIHLGGLQAGQKVLIHGAGGGVGTSLVQLAKLAGAGLVITTSSADKRQRLLEIGADLAIDYKTEDFAQVIARDVSGGAVDVIVDIVGGPYLERNVRSLSAGGRLIQIGTQGGGSGSLPVDLVLQRRLRIEGTVMKSVSPQEKRQMTNRFSARWLAEISNRTLRPIVDRTFPLDEAGQAHQHLESAKNFGKVVLMPC